MGFWNSVNISLTSKPKRLDPQYFSPQYTNIEENLKEISHSSLGEICGVFSKGIFSINASEYISSGVPFVRIGDLKEMEVSLENIAYISAERSKLSNSTELNFGDIILSKTGGAAASLVTVPICNCSQDTIAIKTKENEVNFNSYLVAFLNSKYGKPQMERLFQGNIQAHLGIKEAKRILVPRFNRSFYEKVGAKFQSSIILKEKSKDLYIKAHELLYKELNVTASSFTLKNKNYTSSTSSIISSKRMDPEHFRPEDNALIQSIKDKFDWKYVKDIAIKNGRGLQPEYIEAGDLTVINSRHITSTHLDYVKFEKTLSTHKSNNSKSKILKNDILTYSTGAYIGSTNAYLFNEPAMGSNHVNILRLPPQYNSVYVSFVMNSLIGKVQTEKHSRGSAQAELYPKDIDKFVIPFVNEKLQKQIEDMVTQSLTHLINSRNIKNEAILEVEEEIEKSIKESAI